VVKFSSHKSVGLHRPVAIEVTVRISTSADNIVSFLHHCLDTQHKNMAAIPGNNHEIRHKIKQVQELLDQEIERVNDLKNLLSIAEEKVTQLKRELDEYHARIAPTPINGCPLEILSMIFRLSIPECDTIRHMGHLLLVCKRWYTLVVKDPQMWNTIIFSTPMQWDMRSWSDSTRLYVESCVERSRATSLNINLNFFLLQTTKEQLIERLHYGFFQLPFCTPTEGEGDLVEDWLGNLDYEGLEDDVDTTFNCLPNHAIELIEKLAGVDEAIVERWESFTLWFPPGNHLFSAIWEQLAPKTINLSRLHLIGLCWDDLCDSYAEDDDAIPILNLPQVKDLMIRTLYGWDRFLSFDPSSLHKLSVNTSFEEEFFLEIGRFDQLRTLTLSPGNYLLMAKGCPHRIYLPVLQELVLLGYFINLDAVKFDLPRLKRLVIEWGITLSSVQYTMPMVQPSEVHWALVNERYADEDPAKAADTVIRSFLLHYTSSDCFSVTSLLKGNALKVLKVLSTEGVLPTKWRTVSFHDKCGSVERIQIDNIVCR
jgi:hypothetical protein